MTDRALADITSSYSAFRPPKRVTVAEGAAEALYIKQPGGYTGAWSASETPYMVEPMNMLASRVHEAVCFAGPARTGKTMGLLDGWMAHCVACDPGDMLIVQMTQDKAREYSKTRVDRALLHSPILKAAQSTRANDDNTHDKLFKNGMWLKIGWPTVSQLSSSDYRYVALTDYDRMPDDIDGEGSGFRLGLKRTTTFMSRGMCAVESSPGRDIEDPSWRAATPHEAPPVGGVLGIYNTSDRRRWYWPCPHCEEYFEAKPGLSLFNLPDDDVLLDMVRTADLDELAKQYEQILCPHCAAYIDKKYKPTMNQRGVWVGEGQGVTPDGRLHGQIVVSSIAGYWLGGVAAVYQSWKSLVLRHLQGLREYAASGSELTLQTTANTDQGIPYTSRLLLEAAKGAGDPYSRRDKELERFIVPDEARTIIAAVDIQGGANARFVVQVHAVGRDNEQWIIDRYNIELSERPGMGTEFAPIDPASYAEDWDLLTKHVVNATYRLSAEGKEMRVKMVAVDTGGEHRKKGVGVSEKAYAWYRSLRRQGLSGRVMLVKGASTPKAPLFRQTLVGAQIKGQEGDIPLFMINVNLLKDMVSTSLKRTSAGAGYMNFPEWLPPAFFDELESEVRNPNGTWMQIKKRNESFDLCAYIRAVLLRIGFDKIDWTNPPTWAAPLALNTDVVSSAERRRVQETMGTKPIAPRAPTRRVRSSTYMR